MTVAARAYDKSEEDSTVNSEFTYFLFSHAGDEPKIALLYLQEKHPASRAKRVAELRIDRLTDKHKVIVLVRGRNPLKPATPLTGSRRNEYGIRELVNANPADLVGEMGASEPIDCGKFWNRTAGWEGGDGELDIPGFLQAVAAAASPLRVSWHPEQLPGILKLGHV
jgi:hypothetical protein